MTSPKIIRSLFFLSIGLSVACTQDRTLDEITETEITALGGVARSFDGLAELRFPAGAVDAPVMVTIGTRLGRDLSIASREYEAGPASLPLQKNLEVRISTDRAGRAELVSLTESGVVALPGPGAGAQQGPGWVVGEAGQLSTFALVLRPTQDAGIRDVGVRDVGGRDVGIPDSGAPDRGFFDLGPADTGPQDLGAPDFGTPDSGLQDLGPSDTGPLDLGTPDSEVPDLGPPDMGTPPMPTPICGLNATPEAEPNNTQQTATPGAPGAKTPWSGTLSGLLDTDWFSFSISTAPASLRITTFTQLGDTLSCVGADTRISLVDASGMILATNDDANGTTCSQIVLPSPASGSYSIQVEGTGSYLVSAVLQQSSAPGPDLQVSALNPVPSSWVFGSNAIASVCVENTGDMNAFPNEINLYLGPNMTIGTSSLLLVTSNVQPLGPGSVLQLDVPVIVPTLGQPQTSYLSAWVDPSNLVLETQETNNISAPVSVPLTP